jgi:serine/threonine protein kinase
MAKSTRLPRRHLGGTVGQEGRYWLLRLIAEDSLGKLWAGKDSFLDVPVTVRVPPETLSRDERLVEELRRQLREAYPALDHPNIAAVYYWNEGEAGPVQFVVMEPLPGESLARRLQRGGAIDPREAARIARQIGEGLESAHQLGLSHGNLTPESVMLGEGSIKLLDFGVAAVAALAADRANRPEMTGPLGAVREPTQGRRHDVHRLQMITHQMQGRRESPPPFVPASGEGDTSQRSMVEWRAPARGSAADADPKTIGGAAMIGVTSSPTKETTERGGRRAEVARAGDARAGDPAWGAQVRPRHRWRRRVLVFALGILLGVSAAIVSEQLRDQQGQPQTWTGQTTPSP